MTRLPYICWLLAVGLISSYLLSSCSGSAWSKISPEEVRRLLPQYAMLASSMQAQSTPDSLRVASYSKFFEEQGYTLEDWDSTMAWYAKYDMPLYYDFYRLASDSLAKDLSKLEKKMDSVRQVETILAQRSGYVLDSVNLLNIGADAFRSGELINQSFSVSPNIPYSSARVQLSTYIAGFKQMDKREPLELVLRLSLSDSTSVHRRISISKPGYYEVSVNTPSGLQAVRLSGYLRGVAPKENASKFIFVDSLRLQRFSSSEPTISPALSPGMVNEGEAVVESIEL